MKINIHLKVTLSSTSIQTHKHNNPLGRVVPVESTYEHEDGRLNYDKKKYREMILDAAETVLGYFGFDFDRTVYGNKKNIAKRKWWWLEELSFVFYEYSN